MLILGEGSNQYHTIIQMKHLAYGLEPSKVAYYAYNAQMFKEMPQFPTATGRIASEAASFGPLLLNGQYIPHGEAALWLESWDTRCRS